MRSVSLNNQSYNIPQTGDSGWSNSGGVDDYLVALATGVLSKAGGAFTLTADVDFGTSKGLIVQYLTTQSANAAAGGMLRLANADNISWRNAANSADLSLGVNDSNQLTFAGSAIPTGVVSPTVGGTGVANNAANTQTFSGNFGVTWTLSNTTAVTLPTTGTLSTLAGTETLTNKTLVNPAISQATITGSGSISTATVFADAADATKALNFILSGATTGKTLNISSSHTVGRTWTIQDASDTFVGRNTTDTLTNKTLTSPVIGTIVNTGTLTLPTTTDTIVGRATTDTLTNKTLTAPVQTSYEDWTQVSTPASPAAGKDRLYFKSDDNLYALTSAGIEKQIGSGSGGAGEKNYIGASSQSTAALWTASGSGITVTTDTTAADLPRPNTTGSGIKITGVSGSSDYAYYDFTLDPADYGVKLKIQFAMNALSGYANGDMAVSMYSNTAADYSGTSTRLPLTPTDSSSISALPAAEGTYRTTFDAPNATAPYMRLCIGLNGSNTHSLVISDVIVGPGTVAQSAAVDEIVVTPSMTNGAGLTLTNNLTAQRVGAYLMLNGNLTFTGTGSSGSALLVTFAGMTPSSGQNSAVTISKKTTGLDLTYMALATDFGLEFVSVNTGSAAESVNGTAFGDGSSGLINVVYFNNVALRIAEWAGNGTVNVAQNDGPKFYYGTGGTWGTTGTLTTQQGPGGVLGGTTTPSGNAFTYTIVPSTPIPAGISPRLEISSDQFHWTAVPNNGSTIFVEGLRYDGTNYIGAGVSVNSSGNFVITWGKYASGSTGAWSGTWYWRVAVGDPIQTPGFATVSANSAGLMPSTNTNLDAASATRLGLKQYLHGGSYNGGGAPTVTSAQAGFSVTRAVFLPYQCNGGEWRLRFNIAANFTSATVTSVSISVNGITTKNVSNYYQPISGMFNAGTNGAFIQSTTSFGSGVMGMAAASTTNASGIMLSGDVELDSKPTWAY